jgi:hypothetical protein
VLDSYRRQHAVQLEPQEVVVAVFETERLRLTERAKVKRFVDVLAEKRAKRALEQNER